jgi:cytochrome c oxidase cbb3-type subunit 3/ubiquinol-cytochrome c reductase cytochrome c subunit
LPLGKVPLHPQGADPKGFHVYPKMTPVDTVAAQYARKARMVILDARAPTDYAQQHIAGAVSVPFYDPSPYLDALPKDAWLVCYCGCPHAASGQLARKLLDAGFTKVTVLDERLGDWQQKGHPVRSGESP